MSTHRHTFRLSLVPIIVLVAAVLLAAGARAATDAVFDDNVQWADWSWGVTLDPNATSPVYSGSQSMALTYHRGWAGASFYAGDGLDTSPFTHLTFAVHPNGQPLPPLRVGLYDSSWNLTNSIPIAPYAASDANGWYVVSVPLDALNAAGTTVTRVTIQEGSGSAQPTLFIDGLQFVASSDDTASSGAFIYDDVLAWDNWSWGSAVDPNATWPVSDGANSMAVTYQHGWAGASFYAENGFSTSGYSHLEFAIHPNGQPLHRLRVAIYGTSGLISGAEVTSYGKPVENGWYNFSVPLTALDAANTTLSRIAIQEGSGSAQPTFFIDGLRFSNQPGSPPPATAVATVTEPPTTVNVPTGTATERPTGSFRPPQAPEWIDEIVRDAVARYNLPRWFFYAIIQRESSFRPNLIGSGYDLGLTQLGSISYWGSPYPMGLTSPDNDFQQYAWDMNFPKFGQWLQMDRVSRLYDPFDPKQNIDRFATGYAVPAFDLFKQRYGRSDTETLRMVAFHWNKGLYATYDPGNWDYLGAYDQYVKEFKPTVEAEDGTWNGNPHLP